MGRPLMLMAVVVLAGCQVEGVVPVANDTWVSVEPMEDGWLQARYRTCERAAGEAMQCTDASEDVTAIEHWKQAASDGMEVPAYGTKRECERPVTVRAGAGGETITVRIDRIECVQVENATTRGRGWHIRGEIEACTGEGRCERGTGNAGNVVALLLDGGGALPTFRHRETCEETTSFVMTRQLRTLSRSGVAVALDYVSGMTEAEVKAKIDAEAARNRQAIEDDLMAAAIDVQARAKPATKATARVTCRRYQ